MVPACSFIASLNFLFYHSKICVNQLHFCVILPKMLSPKGGSHWQEKQELQATLKSPPWMLIGHCFIPDGKDESDTEGGMEEGHPAGNPFRKKATIPRRVSQIGETADGVRDGRKVAGVFAHQAVNQEGGRGGTYAINIRGEVGHIRLTASGEAPTRSGLKRPQRYWLGMVSLHEVCRYHMSTKLLICKQPFAHLVCEIVQEQGSYNMCFWVCTVQALQQATEYYMTCLLENVYLCTIHAKYVMIMIKDIHFACHICGEQTK